jgi:predicted amidohydrolase
MNNIRAGVVQFQHRANDKTHNLSVIAELSKQAAMRDVRLLAFPEMCITGYWHVRNLQRRDLELLPSRYRERAMFPI